MQFPEMRDWYNKTDKVLRLPNRSELAFGHSDNESDIFQYAGQEYDFIAVEEVTQFTEFQWDILSQSNRTSKMGIKPVMWATGNPGGIGHLWVKRLWVDRDFHETEKAENYKFIPAKVGDNPALLKADPEYVNVLKRMKDPMLRRAYLDGDWDIFPGQFFGGFNRQECVVSGFQIPKHWTLFGALDYGEAAPTSFGLYAVDYDGRIFRITEYYQGDRSASQHAEEIKQRIKGCSWTGGRSPGVIYADPSMWVKRRINEAHSKSAADEFSERGVYLRRANNDRINGWRVCNQALTDEKFFLFDGWNDNWLRTVPAAPRDDHNIEDLDTTSEDHAADEWRYGMVHMYKPGQVFTEKPKQFASGQLILDDVAKGAEPDLISMFAHN